MTPTAIDDTAPSAEAVLATPVLTPGLYQLRTARLWDASELVVIWTDVGWAVVPVVALAAVPEREGSDGAA